MIGQVFPQLHTDRSLGPGLCSVSDIDIVHEASRPCSEVK